MLAKLKSLVLVSAALYSGLAYGSTLQEALIGAYQNNLELKATHQDVLAYHEKYVQAAAGWRPTVTAQASITGSNTAYSGSTKDTSSQPLSGSKTNTRDGRLVLSQNLYQGGGTVAATSQVDQSVRAQWGAATSKEQEIFLTVIRTYLDLYAKKQELETHRANVAALQKAYQSALEKLKAGEETKTQTANAEAKVAEAQVNLQTAQAEHNTLEAAFLQLTGLAPAKKLAKPDFSGNLPKSQDEAINMGKDQNPDIISAKLTHLAKRSEADTYNAKLLPSLDLEASTARTETRADQRTDTRTGIGSTSYQTNNQVLLRVSMPLYEAGKFRSEKRGALSEATNKRILVEKLRRDVAKGIAEIWQNMTAAKNNLQNYDKQIKATEIGLESTRQEVTVGTKVLLDVLNAQVLWLQARLGKIQTEKNFHLSRFQLLSLVGLLNAKSMKLPVDYFSPEVHYQETKNKF